MEALISGSLPERMGDVPVQDCYCYCLVFGQPLSSDGDWWWSSSSTFRGSPRTLGGTAGSGTRTESGEEYFKLSVLEVRRGRNSPRSMVVEAAASADLFRRSSPQSVALCTAFSCPAVRTTRRHCCCSPRRR